MAPCHDRISDHAVSSEAGLSSTREQGTTSNDITAVAMFVGEVWPLRIVKHSAASESGRVKFGLKLSPLGPLAPEQVARTAPVPQQSRSLLVMPSLLSS